jgi:hypothetical protein
MDRTISRPSTIVSSIAISSASSTGLLRHDRPEQRDLDVVHVRGDVGRRSAATRCSSTPVGMISTELRAPPVILRKPI